MTCSADLSVYIWRHLGDRWQFSYIDISKCFDESLSYQRKDCDRSTKELKLTALCLYPRRRNCIAVGDNKGTVRVFQIQQETATHIGTYQVANGEQIDKIFISENEQVAVMSFQNGRISLYDVKSSFQKIGDIESNSLVAHELVQNSLVVE